MKEYSNALISFARLSGNRLSDKLFERFQHSYIRFGSRVSGRELRISFNASQRTRKWNGE